MKITVATVSGQKSTVDVPEGGTVQDLKDRVAAAGGYASVKLAHKGKTLSEGSDLLSKHKIEDGASVVVVPGKKAAAPAGAPPPAAAAAPAGAAPAAPAAAPPAAGGGAEPAAQAPATAATGEAAFPAETVSSLMEATSASKEVVLQALRMADGDANGAFEFILSMPFGSTAGASGGSGGGGGPAGVAPSGGAEGSGSAGRGGLLPPPASAVSNWLQMVSAAGGSESGLADAAAHAEDDGESDDGTWPPAAATAQGSSPDQPQPTPLQRAFGRLPEWQDIRSRLLNDPQQLRPLLATLREQAPQLYRHLAEHQEEFLTCIRDGCAGVERGVRQPVMPMPLGAFPGGEGALQSILQQQHHQEAPPVEVAEEDAPAVEKLMALGFSKNNAAQAYLASGKNEELAASLLFAQGD